MHFYLIVFFFFFNFWLWCYECQIKTVAAHDTYCISILCIAYLCIVFTAYVTIAPLVQPVTLIVITIRRNCIDKLSPTWCGLPRNLWSVILPYVCSIRSLYGVRAISRNSCIVIKVGRKILVPFGIFLTNATHLCRHAEIKTCWNASAQKKLQVALVCALVHIGLLHGTLVAFSCIVEFS